MRRPIWTALAVFSLVSGTALAQEAGSAKEFTFKRIKVIERSSGVRRGLVQIDPEEQARMLAINPAVPSAPDARAAAAIAAIGEKAAAAEKGAEQGDGASKPVPKASYAWYWDLIPPNLAESRSGRMEEAVAALRNGPGGATVTAPRLSSLQNIADTYGSEILKATVGTKVSPALVLAVIGIESAGRRTAVSHAGASGLMQLMPATAERFGVSNRNDAAQNIRGGVAYLDWLLDHFDRDPILALAGYNAGENAVRKNGGVPPYAETRDYVPKVVAAWNVAKGLCLTAPQLVSDGCVFRRGAQVAQVVDKP
ncbi:lytic transglycosylase domain-containing protein [Tropicimonas sp. TH_r6]|uniref:lytic transglycosylase domain-containing protein n=1 Tax=Tropicimonas sp. TH_r6 TaxID=3082085 RepID=UPI002954C397|nr:lytic transglycosylase domain-containing protein [Tropicimonas sp. TH_r6]MDV7145290.1 lytic transglycosylase domain-containing protein [Tropicimonas sp. TH_r6]